MREHEIWTHVQSFVVPSNDKSFRFVDERATRLKIPTHRFHRGDTGYALLVPFRRFCETSKPEVSWSLVPQFRQLLGEEDQLLFVSTPSLLATIDPLVAILKQDFPQTPTTQWVAAPVDEKAKASGPNSDIGNDDIPVAGRLVLEGRAGERYAFELHSLASSFARQILPSSPHRKYPEGPNNLSRRENWFRGKIGKRNKES